MKQDELNRRSTAPGSGPDGNGTAADAHKTWGCLSLDAVSKECAGVLKDFADMMLHQERCKADAANAGCTMLKDLKGFIDENGDLIMDMLQLTLMACGLIPVYGEICDGIDAAISFGRGEWVDGLLSAGSMVPVVGWLSAAGKGWKNSDKFRDLFKIIENLKKKKIPGCPFAGKSMVPPRP